MALGKTKMQAKNRHLEGALGLRQQCFGLVALQSCVTATDLMTCISHALLLSAGGSHGIPCDFKASVKPEHAPNFCWELIIRGAGGRGGGL